MIFAGKTKKSTHGHSAGPAARTHDGGEFLNRLKLHTHLLETNANLGEGA